MKQAATPATMIGPRFLMQWLCLLVPVVLASKVSSAQAPDRASPAWMPFKPSDFQIGACFSESNKTEQLLLFRSHLLFGFSFVSSLVRVVFCPALLR
eukprot:538625-Amphidinium_carterae.1